jgi:hypothetical protein
LNVTPATQESLSGAYGVLPFLTEMPTIDDPIYCVIAQVGVYAGDRLVELDRRHRSVTKQVQNGVREYGMRAATCRARTQQRVVEVAEAPVKLLAQAIPKAPFGGLAHHAELRNSGRKSV